MKRNTDFGLIRPVKKANKELKTNMIKKFIVHCAVKSIVIKLIKNKPAINNVNEISNCLL